MKNVKPLHVILAVYGLYLIVIFSIAFKKPEGWSFLPYAWQQAWHPNYLLLILLVLIGAAVSYFIYKLLQQKESNKNKKI